MLQWKSAQSICPQCRHRLVAAASRRSASASSRQLATESRASQQLRSRIRHKSLGYQSRSIQGSSRWRKPSVQPARREDTEPEDPPPLPPDGSTSHKQSHAEAQTSQYELEYSTPSKADLDSTEQSNSASQRAPPDEMARAARNFFGESLPQGALSEEEFGIYRRMYGEPSSITTDHLKEEMVWEAEDGQVLERDNEDGTVDEYDVVEEEEDMQIADEYYEEEEGEEDGVFNEVEDLQERVKLLALQRQAAQESEGSSALTFGELREEDQQDLDDEMSKSEKSKDDVLEEIYDNWPDDHLVRTHPLTEAGRWGTKPSTLLLPQDEFVKPVQAMLANVSNKHLAEAAMKTLGGVGIPDSPSTPAIGRSKGQRPIPLTAFQGRMTSMEADVFVSSVMPQVYASCVSVLVECRKRLGREWLQGLMNEGGGKGPLILDAGAGGAGVLAMREVMKAEWQNLSEEKGVHRPAEFTRRSAPLGRATVVTASDSLRHRASELLENTTFIPRLPDFVPAPDVEETNKAQPRKRYDVIIAPHSLWTLAEDHDRKSRLRTLWSLLNDHGVLILIEKGVPRGFEVIAGAREQILNRLITTSPEDNDGQSALDGAEPKTPGMIIAPCTNHTKCPLYTIPGVSRGRKDWCHFQQRYTRPNFLMNVLQAKARNHDDVEFSYLAVRKGEVMEGVEQGVEATERARSGYGPRNRTGTVGEALGEGEEVDEVDEVADELEVDEASGEGMPHMLTLPRIMPAPLKRKGHILLDVCTPAGTYERWMVRKSMGKQAFRDGRKAKWGDLWAMGASSSEERRVKLGTPMEVVRLQTKRARERVKGHRKGRDGGKGKWSFSSEGVD